MLYHIHNVEFVVPRSSITNMAYSPTLVKVYFKNRAPISSEVEKESLLRDLGREDAERIRRVEWG